MSEPFLAEIKIVAFNFAPGGWAFCDGQILPISQNQSLYSLLGTTYGGDGRTSFGLPELRGRTPIHVDPSGGPAFSQGGKGGAETHTLAVPEMPQHKHSVQGSSSNADAPIPNNSVLAAANNLYRDATNPVALRSGTLAAVGGGQAHENMQPWIAVNFCIALLGLFPSRN